MIKCNVIILSNDIDETKINLYNKDIKNRR